MNIPGVSLWAKFNRPWAPLLSKNQPLISASQLRFSPLVSLSNSSKKKKKPFILDEKTSFFFSSFLQLLFFYSSPFCNPTSLVGNLPPFVRWSSSRKLQKLSIIAIFSLSCPSFSLNCLLSSNNRVPPFPQLPFFHFPSPSSWLFKDSSFSRWWRRRK